MELKVKYLFPNIHELISDPCDSGFDIRAAITEPLKIEGFGKACIPTGIAVELADIDFTDPDVSVELQVRPRSGHTRQGIVAQFGTIDASYRGEIHVNIFNHNAGEVEIQPLERIAQLVVCPIFKPKVVTVKTLTTTARGGNGFGSTGKD